MPKLTAIRKHSLDEMVKQSLFEATVTVLGEYGIAGMTMDRVAAAAGMAKGSLYRYFTSKTNLLEFVYEKLASPLYHELEDIASSERSAVEKLTVEIGVVLKHIANHVQVYKLLFEDEDTHCLVQPVERRTAAVSRKRLTRIFRQGIEEGAFKAADPLLLASMFMGVFRGTLETQPNLADDAQRTNIQHLVLDTFFNGILRGGQQ